MPNNTWLYLKVVYLYAKTETKEIGMYDKGELYLAESSQPLSFDEFKSIYWLKED